MRAGGVHAGIPAHNWICFYVIFECDQRYDYSVTATVVCIEKRSILLFAHFFHKLSLDSNRQHIPIR